MKIIEEIEKSRLTEDGMTNIIGGEGNTCNSPNNPYLSCGEKYKFDSCKLWITCNSEYYLCVGTQTSQKEACRPGFWTECSKEIWLS